VKKGLLLCCCVVLTNLLAAQDIEWKAGLFHFFDNTENSGSTYQFSQTMAGVRFSPEVGLCIGQEHHLSVGLSALKEYGSPNFTDATAPTAYYHYEGNSLRFYMGAFPRAGLLDDFSRAFVQDSFQYYRPNLNGFLVWYHRPDIDAKAFLDWTGKQSSEVHESFFVGGSFFCRKELFFAEMQGYMFHHAGSLDVRGVRDNMLTHVALGLDLSDRTWLDSLSVSVGYLGGLERHRATSMNFKACNGCQIILKAGYKGFGLESSTYWGQGLMKDYTSMGSELYWGDPFYRGSFYNRSDVMYDFLRLPFVTARINMSQHFSENKLFLEQSLVVRINLDQKTKKPSSTYGKK
jgi:hypothetical protein